MTTLPVSKPATIAELCTAAGLEFSAGCGFYELVKSEKISASKDMVAIEKSTGQQVVGAQQVRQKLGLASGDITVAPKTLKAGWTLYVQSTSNNRKLTAGSSAFILGDKGGAPARVRGAMSGEWGEARLEDLSALFLRRGEIHSEPKEGSDVLAYEADLGSGLDLPASLRALLRLGAKWNFTKGSYDCSVCNIYTVAPAKTTFIFGDEEGRADWVKSSGEESAAGKDWALVCVTSEFDYIFVNVRRDSRDFGATRHIVNNDCEDEPFTAAPFERFLDVVEAWARASAEKMPAEGEGESDIEYDDLREFLPAKRMKTAAADPPVECDQ